MSAQHTTGPWHVVRYGDGDSLVICLDEAGNRRVAFMATPGCRDQQERRKVWKEIKANARLIAAAPEMVVALRNASGFLDNAVMRRRHGDDWLYGATVESIRAILAKIDGEG